MDRLIRRTAAQAVADTVEASIIAGEFKAGSFLPAERKLAAMLGVSRLTLREGLSRLISRGTLVAVPGMGTCVTSVRFAPGLESMPAAFQLEEAKLRKFEIMQQFLEFRRFVMTEILVLACVRCPDEKIGWIESELRQVVFAVERGRSIDQVLWFELNALRCAAQLAETWPFWLTLNTVERFFDIAREELSEGIRPEDLKRRAGELMMILSERDADRMRTYVTDTLGAADKQQVRRFYRRLHGGGDRAKQVGGASCAACPARLRDPVRAFGHLEQASNDDRDEVSEPTPAEVDPLETGDPAGSVGEDEASSSTADTTPADEAPTEETDTNTEAPLGPTPYEAEYYDPEELRMFKLSFGRMPWELDGFDPTLPLPSTGPPKPE